MIIACTPLVSHEKIRVWEKKKVTPRRVPTHAGHVAGKQRQWRMIRSYPESERERERERGREREKGRETDTDTERWRERERERD